MSRTSARETHGRTSLRRRRWSGPSTTGRAAPCAAVVQFDETYPYAAGEDRDWCHRLAALGHRLEIEERAVVVHRHRLGVRSFLRQHFRYGRGAYRYRRDHPEARGVPPRFYVDLVRSGFDHGPTAGLAVCLSQVATATGFALEALASRRR